MSRSRLWSGSDGNDVEAHRLANRGQTSAADFDASWRELHRAFQAVGKRYIGNRRMADGPNGERFPFAGLAEHLAEPRDETRPSYPTLADQALSYAFEAEEHVFEQGGSSEADHVLEAKTRSRPEGLQGLSAGHPRAVDAATGLCPTEAE
jgi:hypothetical protein